MAEISLSQHTPIVQNETAAQGAGLSPVPFHGDAICGIVSRISAQLPLPAGDIRQTISTLSALVERAQNILAALPANMGANMGEENHG